MAKKLLLCASTFHITAALWTGRRLVGCRGFEDDEAGTAAFQNLLRSTARRAGVPDGRHGRRGLPLRDPAARQRQRSARDGGAQAQAALPQHALLRLPAAAARGRQAARRSLPVRGADQPEDLQPLAAVSSLASRGADRRGVPAADGEPGADQAARPAGAQPAAGVQAQRRRAADLLKERASASAVSPRCAPATTPLRTTTPRRSATRACISTRSTSRTSRMSSPS